MSIIRPYRGEKELVIGCGDLSDWECPPSSYTLQHAHHGQFCVNELSIYNPNIVMRVGDDDLLEFLPRTCFDLIICENMCVRHHAKYGFVDTLL